MTYTYYILVQKMTGWSGVVWSVDWLVSFSIISAKQKMLKYVKGFIFELQIWGLQVWKC